jgi:predicted HAD superfamily Cof-like phosphohydrolase
MDKLTSKENLSSFDAVFEFHRKQGHAIGETALESKTQRPPLPAAIRAQRLRLMIEECAETVVAYHEGNLLEFVDGLCDTLYVVAGTAVALGVGYDDKWMLYDSGHPVHLPSTTDENFQRCVTSMTVSIAQLCLTLHSTSSAENTRYFLEGAVIKLNQLAAYCNAPFIECFREVQRANMTKRANRAAAVERGQGMKYGDTDPKGEGYEPANLKPLLGIE